MEAGWWGGGGGKKEGLSEWTETSIPLGIDVSLPGWGELRTGIFRDMEHGFSMKQSLDVKKDEA